MRSQLDIEVCALLREAQAIRTELRPDDQVLLVEYEREVLGGVDEIMQNTRGQLEALIARANIR